MSHTSLLGLSLVNDFLKRTDIYIEILHYFLSLTAGILETQYSQHYSPNRASLTMVNSELRYIRHCLDLITASIIVTLNSGVTTGTSEAPRRKLDHSTLIGDKVYCGCIPLRPHDSI